jgi:hypothetical protein
MIRILPVLLILGALACDAEPEPEAASDSLGETGDVDDESGEDDGESSGEETGATEIVCDDEPVITFDTFGRGFLATYCNGCHGGEVLDRKGAPPTVSFDDRETASVFAERILVRVVPPEGVTPMPPAGGVTEDDLERLRIWLTCYP